MRKYIVILVCLLVGVQLSAVNYQPLTYTAPATDFRSTSAYNGSYQPQGSFSAISASNFAALNSEGGACYSPANAMRRGRGRHDDGNGGTIGFYEFRSPIGDTPWILIALLASGYVILRKKRKKSQKNLHIS